MIGRREIRQRRGSLRYHSLARWSRELRLRDGIILWQRSHFNIKRRNTIGVVRKSRTRFARILRVAIRTRRTRATTEEQHRYAAAEECCDHAIRRLMARRE